MTDTFLLGGDLPVRRIGFGALRLPGRPAAARTRAVAVARRAVDLGVTLIDTADSYDLGDNETLLAEALHPYPDSLVLATKAGRINLGDAWYDCGRPEYLRQQAELSLRRLRLDRIDLFQLHRIDATVPPADQYGALRQLRDEGKVRHVGLSEVSVAEIEAARRIVPVAAVQNRYNLSDRRHEDVLAYCERHGIAFLPWLPVAPRTLTPAARAVAARHDATPPQVALAWLLQRSRVLLPIPGTASQRHLAENVAAATLQLSTEDVAALTAEPAGLPDRP
ncbi:oxidoreductase [Actinocatenispora thailandica]|uniref:Oxidoreductase n=1 Tax=Actinocatenispora thailandica TaxID=227318 RepID=A0A7R7HVX9_9ACTN|nr:aldo/keto reductase [Actinocatenispora thailandica]BCJ34308.1 oxidoreductase [Actinocatenispora thailandica]